MNMRQRKHLSLWELMNPVEYTYTPHISPLSSSLSSVVTMWQCQQSLFQHQCFRQTNPLWESHVAIRNGLYWVETLQQALTSEEIENMYRVSIGNTSGSLGEWEMLWEHKPQASVSTAFSISPKLSRVFLYLDRNTAYMYMFSISFRKHGNEKKENNLLTLIIKM